MGKLSVCVLAHNEEKHIAETIRSIYLGNDPLDFDIIVYANGCDDNTTLVVKKLTDSFPNVFLRELKRASKPLAWNVAFEENTHPVIIFSDGDVQPEPGTIQYLKKVMEERSDISLAGCQIWPKNNMPIYQRFVGIIQIPLVQDYLAGGFYALRREVFVRKFKDYGFDGIPAGVVSDDGFIESMVSRLNYLTVKKKVYYEPPRFQDYLKYLARIRWQNEQLVQVLRYHNTNKEGSFLKKSREKLSQTSGVGRLILGITATCLRYSVKILFAKTINEYHQRLGPVTNKGDNVLTSTTRSQSTK